MATTKPKKTTTAAAKKKAPVKKCAKPTAAAAKKSVKKAAPAKKAAIKKAPAKATAAKKAPAKKAVAKAAPAKAAPAKKTAAKKGTSKKSFRKAMCAMLTEDKKRLLSELSTKIKNESDGNKKEIGDIYDIASSERERELTLMLGDRDRDKILQIDRALEWIEEDEYGLCEECEEPIGDNRMRALPFTRVCVECKSKFEKNTLYKGRLADSPLGMGDKSDSGDDDL